MGFVSPLLLIYVLSGMVFELSTGQTTPGGVQVSTATEQPGGIGGPRKGSWNTSRDGCSVTIHVATKPASTFQASSTYPQSTMHETPSTVHDNPVCGDSPADSCMSVQLAFEAWWELKESGLADVHRTCMVLVGFPETGCEVLIRKNAQNIKMPGTKDGLEHLTVRSSSIYGCSHAVLNTVLFNKPGVFLLRSPSHLEGIHFIAANKGKRPDYVIRSASLLSILRCTFSLSCNNLAISSIQISAPSVRDLYDNGGNVRIVATQFIASTKIDPDCHHLPSVDNFLPLSVVHVNPTLHPFAVYLEDCRFDNFEPYLSGTSVFRFQIADWRRSAGISTFSMMRVAFHAVHPTTDIISLEFNGTGVHVEIEEVVVTSGVQCTQDNCAHLSVTFWKPNNFITIRNSQFRSDHLHCSASEPCTQVALKLPHFGVHVAFRNNQFSTFSLHCRKPTDGISITIGNKYEAQDSIHYPKHPPTSVDVTSSNFSASTDIPFQYYKGPGSYEKHRFNETVDCLAAASGLVAGLYAECAAAWIRVTLECKGTCKLLYSVNLTNNTFYAGTGQAMVRARRVNITLNGHTILREFESERKGASTKPYSPFIADQGIVFVNGPVIGPTAVTFPRYPSRRKIVIHRFNDWGRRDVFRAAPGRKDMMFTSIVSDTYCTPMDLLQINGRWPWKTNNRVALFRKNMRQWRVLSSPRTSATPTSDGFTELRQCDPTWTLSNSIDAPMYSTGCYCPFYTNNHADLDANFTNRGTCLRSSTIYDYCPTSGLFIVNILGFLTQALTTKTRWIFFNAANVGCFKIWNNTLYVMVQTCGREDWAIVGRSLQWRHPQDKALHDMGSLIAKDRGTISNIVPGPQFTYTPWAFLQGADWSSSLDERAHVSPEQRTGLTGSVTLLVSPGEAMILNIATVDDGLSLSSTAVTLQVHSDHAANSNGTVLLVQVRAGISKAKPKVVTTIPFLSGKPMSGFSLAGEPYMSGFLAIAVPESGLQEWRSPVVLKVPFILQPCHMGYELVTEHDDGKPLLTCKRLQHNGILSERLGKTIKVAAGYWAGNVRDKRDRTSKVMRDILGSDGSEIQQIPMNGAILIATLRRIEAETSFGITQCSHKFCHSFRWWLGPGESGCRSGHTGPLCGQCKKGKSMIIDTLACRTCASPSIHVYAYMALVMVLTILMFLLMFYFNVGMSPLVDSWLFFFQVAPIVVPFFNFPNGMMSTLLTFGLGHLCIKPELNRMQIQAMLLLQPITLLALVFLVRIAASYSCTGTFLQRQQKHMRLVRVLWFGLVYSYTMLTFTSINLLQCTELSNKFVLAIDGSIECFKGAHIPYAVCAGLISAFILLPPPAILLLPQAKRRIFFKGFIDQACAMYGDNRRWWASINLLRRCAIAVIVSQIHHLEMKSVITTLFLFVYLYAHAIWRPLVEKNFLGINSNLVETLFLFSLCLLSMTNSAVRIIGSHFSAMQTLAIVLAYLPTVVLVFALLARQCCAKRGGFGRLRHLSLRACWRKRHGLDIRDQQTADLALDNMLSEAREPLLVTELLHEHGRCK
ncbi:uncharacterized protein LOC135819463 [Sycon ciliatum]|uniref:uncharacterized protein LOC135819463 n=1 Tax=Sycon ciliatum TaxID=27933 RepID=UPI0031F6C2DE